MNMNLLPKHMRFCVLAAALLVGSLAIDYTFAENENIYEEIQRFDKVLYKIDRNYVEEIKPDKLIDAAIEGMREILDPHTAYFEKKDYDDLIVQTRAEFGGLGITISIRDKVLTVVSPLPGTPAAMMGIRAGDRILKIDGKSTRGITVDKAVSKLRGQPGTQVTVTIEREGDTKPVDYTVTRDIIKVKSVPYAGMLDDSTGYIRLVSFSTESGKEVEQALQKMRASNKLCGVILDLRNNPGGLLPSAIEVAGKFLDKDKLVVYTQGRMPDQNQKYRTVDAAVLPEQVPLIVMVNEGSASAAEIVAGAIQDNDRGAIAGRESYGKGSVQTVLPLGLGKESYLKLTTAYYYTPAGRCINKPKNDIRLKHLEEDLDEDGEGGADSGTVKDSAKAARTVYHTNGGRTVYGGGGITPDVVLENQKWERIEEAMERKTLFFKYAIKKIAEMKEKNIKMDEKFKVTDEMLADFRAFTQRESLSYETNAEMALKNFESAFQNEYGDSAGVKADKQAVARVKQLLADLKGKIALEKKEDFTRSRDYIQRSIKRELLAAGMGEDARYKYVLTYDPQVTETAKLIRDRERYRKLISLAK